MKAAFSCSSEISFSSHLATILAGEELRRYEEFWISIQGFSKELICTIVNGVRWWKFIWPDRDWKYYDCNCFHSLNLKDESVFNLLMDIKETNELVTSFDTTTLQVTFSREGIGQENRRKTKEEIVWTLKWLKDTVSFWQPLHVSAACCAFSWLVSIKSYICLLAADICSHCSNQTAEIGIGKHQYSCIGCLQRMAAAHVQTKLLRQESVNISTPAADECSVCMKDNCTEHSLDCAR